MSSRIDFSITGTGLRRGERLLSPNGKYELAFKDDGRLHLRTGPPPFRPGGPRLYRPQVISDFGIPPNQATELNFSLSNGTYVGLLGGPPPVIRLATLTTPPTALEVTDDGAVRILAGATELWRAGLGATPQSPLDQALAAAPQGVRDLLGSAVGPESPVGNNGLGRQFGGGWFFWSPDTGGHEVHGDIATAYLATGGPDGEFGFPTTDEEPWIAVSTDGRSSTFERGNITWTPEGGPSVNYPPRANYVVSVRRGEIRVANIATGDATGIKIPDTKIDSAKQKEIVDKIADGVKDYLEKNKDALLDGRLKAEDVLGTTYAMAGAIVAAVVCPLLAPLIVPAATQQGKFYGAAIDDVAAVLKGEALKDGSRASVGQIVVVFSTVVFIQYQGTLSLVALAGADGWSILKKLGKEVGGALEDAVRVIEGAVGSFLEGIFGTIIGAGDWVLSKLNITRMRLQLATPNG